ncbi:winged helix-turn-helix transcriptional regulator [Elizabethkingia meningoseptica]|uniref:winged helix-turn-helix transcriptional regulator n=1 Tax=Elizabethkingia meningoseptica TaxID=238 RepID=UPI003891E862
MGHVKKNGNIREASCDEELRAMRDCLYVIGGKWKLLILRYLYNRKDLEINFTKILNDLHGISPKVLTKELKDLEQNQLICRKQNEDKVPKVFYRISEYGTTVIPLTENIVQWGLDHRTKITE